jgi:hypothetical protein
MNKNALDPKHKVLTLEDLELAGIAGGAGDDFTKTRSENDGTRMKLEVRSPGDPGDIDPI